MATKWQSLIQFAKGEGKTLTPTKKLAIIAMLVAQASVLHFLESLLPNPIPIPGVKLGLANIITLLALLIFDFKTAMQITVLRTILGSMLSGTLFGVGFFMSFSGAVASTAVMALGVFLGRGMGIISISVVGAVAHNLGQLLMAALILRFAGIIFYLPFMLLFSVPTGIITGLLVKQLLDHIRTMNNYETFFSPTR